MFPALSKIDWGGNEGQIVEWLSTKPFSNNGISIKCYSSDGSKKIIEYRVFEDKICRNGVELPRLVGTELTHFQITLILISSKYSKNASNLSMRTKLALVNMMKKHFSLPTMHRRIVESIPFAAENEAYLYDSVGILEGGGMAFVSIPLNGKTCRFYAGGYVYCEDINNLEYGRRDNFYAGIMKKLKIKYNIDGFIMSANALQKYWDVAISFR